MYVLPPPHTYWPQQNKTKQTNTQNQVILNSSLYFPPPLLSPIKFSLVDFFTFKIHMHTVLSPFKFTAQPCPCHHIYPKGAHNRLLIGFPASTLVPSTPILYTTHRDTLFKKSALV